MKANSSTPKDIESRIKRLAKFINGLSAWNLHRGEEAIQELLQDARIDELMMFDEWLRERSHLDGRSAPYRRVRDHIWLRKDNLDRLAKLRKQHPIDDKQDGGE